MAAGRTLSLQILSFQGKQIMKHLWCGIAALLFTAPFLRAQSVNYDSLWQPYTYLVGEWSGDGKGNPGQGSGIATFSYDLNRHALVRKNHTEFPATNGRPAAVHDDLMVIYYEQGTGMRALYADNESHVIHYTVRAAGDTIEFLGDKNPAAPRFRLTYIRTGERTADLSFDMAMPNAPDAFRHYLTGGMIKK
jgi:hypothetical protein